MFRDIIPDAAGQYDRTVVAGNRRDGRFSVRFPPYIVYLVVGGIGALLMCFLTPPFEVPDEPQHFYRSFELSELEVWGSLRDGVLGSVLPSSLPELVEHFLGTRISHVKRQVIPHPWSDTWAQLDKPLEPERREFVAFGTIAYAPFNYVPQAIGIAFARMMGAPPLAELYAGRLANAVFSVVLIAWALQLMPIGREAALAAALLPTWQFLLASLSPDATILSSAMIVTAFGLRCYCYPEWPVRNAMILGVAGVVLCTIKPVYLPLLVLGLPAALPSPHDTQNTRRSKLMIAGSHVIIVSIVLAITAAWLLSNASLFASVAPDPTVEANGGQQIVFLESHPFAFVPILLRTFLRDAGAYFWQGIGVLGWLNLPLPVGLRLLALAAFFLATFAPMANRPLPPWLLAWATLLIVGSVILVELALYLAWTPLAAPAVDGVQGRYFLPMLPLAGATIASVAAARRGFMTAMYPIAIAALALTTLGMLVVVAAEYRVLL
jgi:uncharacterized membrane protein